MTACELGADQIPVSLLTGFLGSGKTTVLRHLVRQPVLRRTAVVINEFGEIGLDHELIASSTEDTVVLNSGCLCCSIRSDLSDTLRRLFLQRVRDEIGAFDRVVIETTGLADPAPILHTLMTDPLVSARYRLDGVITVVDAVHGWDTLDRQPEAVKQVAVADRLLLSKTDLVDQPSLVRLSDRLKGLNPAAPRAAAAHGVVDPAMLFDAGLYDSGTKSCDVARWLRSDAYPNAHLDNQGHPHPHHTHGENTAVADAVDVNRHDARIRAVCMTADQPLEPAAFQGWLQRLQALRGSDLLRLKGIVNLADGEDRPLVIHAVQHVFHPPVRLEAWPSTDRRTRVVLIMRDMDETTVRALAMAAGLGMPG